TAGGMPAAGKSGGAGGDHVDLKSKPPKIKIDKLKLPKFKAQDHRGKLYESRKGSLFRARGYSSKESRSGEDDPRQISLWEAAVDASPAAKKLESPPFGFKPNQTYRIGVKGKPQYDRVGDAAAIASGLKRPFWNRQREVEAHHVDHIVELQVAGW